MIDTAKAIAAGVLYPGDVWDFYHTEKRPERVLPTGVVLTIPAAGSESSDGSVITREEENEKKSFCSPLLYPKFAILNPELCYTLPNCSGKRRYTGPCDGTVFLSQWEHGAVRPSL